MSMVPPARSIRVGAEVSMTTKEFNHEDHDDHEEEVVYFVFFVSFVV